MWPLGGAKSGAKADESTPLASKTVDVDKDQDLTPPAPDDGSTPRTGGETSVLGATAILATFSTTSSNVMFPATYGTLGIFFGPLLGIIIQTFMAFIAVITVRLATRLGCRTLGELGFMLGGPTGKQVLSSLQQLNNALFMPVALVLCAESLRQVVLIVMRCTSVEEDGPLDVGTCAWWACNINSLWVVSLFAWPVLLLARDVGELAWNAFLSIVLIIVQTGAIFDNAASTGPSGNASYVPEDAILFGTTVESQQNWYTVVAAVGTYLYSFCPLFIAVEVAADMEHPESITTAVIISFVFNITVYLVTGIFVVDQWGAGLPNPVTEVLSGTPSLIANLILFYCTFLDFAIVGAVLNKEIQKLWMPSFDRVFDLRNLPTWLLLTLPSLVGALALSILTPQLDTLAGFLESLCIPFVMLIGVPAMLLLLRSRRDSVLAPLAATHDKEARVQLTALELVRGLEPAFVVSVVGGALLTVAIFAETLYSIFFETEYSGRFFCDVVA